MKGAKGEAGVTGPAGHPGATSGYGKQSAPGKCLCYLGSITALIFTINFKRSKPRSKRLAIPKSKVYICL